MGSRTWIKIYCDRWLNGTLREESPEYRGIWIDLLVLAGSGKYGDSGEVKITDNIGFLDQQLADLLQISLQKWGVYKKKLQKSGRVSMNNNNIIIITNWAKYQSEYNRQRTYRQPQNEPLNSNPKLLPKVTTESTTSGVTKGTLRDKRVEKESSSSSDIFAIYEQEIGAITPISAEEVKDAEKLYGSDVIRDAIKEAVKAGKREWRYVLGILENWATQGEGGNPELVRFGGNRDSIIALIFREEKRKLNHEPDVEFLSGLRCKTDAELIKLYDGYHETLGEAKDGKE